MMGTRETGRKIRRNRLWLRHPASTTRTGPAGRRAAWVKTASQLCMAMAAIFLPAANSQASLDLGIQITGLNFAYDESQNGSLFDAQSIAGGHGLTSEATQVTQIDFFLGGQKVGTLSYSDGLYCDFLVQGIYNIPKGGGVVQATSSGPGFGFDLLSSSLGEFLALDLDAVTVTYTSSKIGNSVRFSFVAGGPSAEVVSQDLPFGLVIDPNEPISVLVSSSNVSNYTDVGNYVTAFSTTGGTATVSGEQVPEPVCFVVLLGLGMIGLKVWAWRKRI
jgi:hypothetical protein